MPWPWNRPKSPFGSPEFEDAISPGSTTTTSSSSTQATSLSASLNEVVSSNTGNGNGPSRNSVSMTNRNVAGGRQITTTASRATTPTPAPNVWASSSTTAGNGIARASSSLGFNHDAVSQSRGQNTRRNSRDTANTLNNSNSGSIRRTASVIPEDHTVQQRTSVDRSPPSSSSGTPNLRPIRRPSSSRDSDFRNATSPENVLSKPQPSVESLSSVSSSLHSDVNSHPHHHHHGKRSLSTSSNSPLNTFHVPISPGFPNGRAFSPTPSVGSVTHQTSITRSQKAIIPPGSRQSNASEEQVFIYELPESYEQVNGLNSHEIEERDLRHKAVVELNPAPGVGGGGHGRTRSNVQSREMMLEAEVARLRKLCEKYKRNSINNTSTSSIGSMDHSIIPDVAAAAAGSSEAHRVVKVMKVANEHLQKKIDARDALLADRLAELEQVQNRHAIELEQQKQGYQIQMRQLADKHRRELEGATQKNVEEVVALKRGMIDTTLVVEGQRRDAEKIATLQAEVEGLKAMEKVKSNGHNAALEEAKLKAAEELEAAKKAFEEAEERWEIKTEEMRRELFEEKKLADCACDSKATFDTIEELKREHDTEIAALKTSIRILEGSRGTTVEQLEEDQRIYRKVTELESSLASKVRALTSERKTSERLRASLTAIEDAKSELQLQKEAAEAKLLEASAGSTNLIEQERQAIAEEIQQEWQKEHSRLKEKYEAALEAEKTRAQQLAEQHESDQRTLNDRITNLLREHAKEKEQIDATHSLALSSLEDSIKAQNNTEITSLKEELVARARSLGEVEAELVIAKSAVDEALKQQQTTLEKEKEALIAEYQVVINAGDRLRDQEKATFQTDKQHLERLLIETKAQYDDFKAQSNAALEGKVKSATTELESRLLETQREHLVEKQALCKAVEDAKSQLVVQQSALELRLQTQLQEAEQQFLLRRESERLAEAAKLETFKAEVEKGRVQHQDEIQHLTAENKATKDRAAEVVAELQQQLKDEEENKQQLLDRVAKAESEKDTTESELASLTVRFGESNEAKKRAETQAASLTEEKQTLKSALEEEKRVANDSITDLRTQLQSREKLINELHTKHQQEAENLQFQIRTAQTKLDIDSVEIESLKETIREKENTFNTLRDEKNNSGSLWVEEKRTLATKHSQIIEGHLSTIAKLEDTINKMRARTTEDAKAAEVKAAEQQGLVAQWMSNSNRKTDEVQRLERALKDANGKTESFKLDVKALVNDIKQYEKESKDRKAEIKSLSKELKSSQEENVSLKSQLESTSGSSYRHARQISDLESKIQALAKEIQDSRTEISAQKRAVAKRDSTIKQLEDTLQQRGGIRNGRASPGPSSALTAMENGIVPSTASVSSLQRDLRDSRAEITRLNEKLEMYETEYRHFFEDHEKLKAEHEQGQKAMKAKLEAFIPEIEQLRKGKRDLELRLQSAELRLAASGGLIRRGTGDEEPTMRSQSSMSYLRHGEISIGSLDG
ncbi:hypothetical protein TWF718_007088 [Orbilia javanica]|uniref:Uncharacterized protein n=1 Tax=Orbilia javanica TaxID=47235 RepID=A0AAN8RCZ2_9PEZI